MYVYELRLLIPWSSCISQLAACQMEMKRKSGQQSFRQLQQNRVSLDYFSCFLILLLDLSESQNCPTNKEICDTERSERRIKRHPHTRTRSLMRVPRSQPEIQEKPAQSHNCCSIYFFKSLWAWHHLSLFRQSQRLLSQGGCLTCSRSLFSTLLKYLLGGVFIQVLDSKNVAERMHCSTLSYSVTLICILIQCEAEPVSYLNGKICGLSVASIVTPKTVQKQRLFICHLYN